MTDSELKRYQDFQKEKEEKANFESWKKYIGGSAEDDRARWHGAYMHTVRMEKRILEQEQQLEEYRKFFKDLDKLMPKRE